MSQKEIGNTIQIAQKLVGHLPKETDDELKILIARAEEGQDTTTEVMDLLSTHENSLLWLLEQVDLQSGQKGATTRGYVSLAGDPSAPTSKKWLCPKVDCGESLPVIQEGEYAPTCRLHGVVMVETGKKKG